MVLVIKKSNETCDDGSYCMREIPTWHGNDVRKLVISHIATINEKMTIKSEDKRNEKHRE